MLRRLIRPHSSKSTVSPRKFLVETRTVYVSEKKVKKLNVGLVGYNLLEHQRGNLGRRGGQLTRAYGVLCFVGCPLLRPHFRAILTAEMLLLAVM